MEADSVGGGEPDPDAHAHPLRSRGSNPPAEALIALGRRPVPGTGSPAIVERSSRRGAARRVHMLRRVPAMWACSTDARARGIVGTDSAAISGGSPVRSRMSGPQQDDRLRPSPRGRARRRARARTRAECDAPVVPDRVLEPPIEPRAIDDPGLEDGRRRVRLGLMMPTRRSRKLGVRRSLRIAAIAAVLACGSS